MFSLRSDCHGPGVLIGPPAKLHSQIHFLALANQRPWLPPDAVDNSFSRGLSAANETILPGIDDSWRIIFVETAESPLRSLGIRLTNPKQVLCQLHPSWTIFWRLDEVMNSSQALTNCLQSVSSHH